MATIQCRPGAGPLAPARPCAGLGAGKPRAGWASRSGLLEGALRALLWSPLGCPAPTLEVNALVSARIGAKNAASQPSSPLLLSVWEEIIGFRGARTPSTTGQVRRAADGWSRVTKEWS
ncbi:hypothetical protein GCM10010346_64810 [Streptomyces chryseus]|uniref:Uncharacterized protein n=1 Tax=Streptomyces chryseus TaxID=68186 RepID=A0ABQ3EF09_9ACTN|nr:hypothetical protein GCM10010346_64810 [Streptomyces chryseus]